MGKYQHYPNIRPSGIDWVGDIPSHWSTRRVKFLFRRMQRLLQKQDDIVTAFRDGEVTLRSNRRTEGFTNSVKEIGYQGVRKGDLVVHAMDGFAGAIGVSDSDGKCSPVYSICVPENIGEANTAYYGRLLRNMAVSGFVTALAKGIRERSTEFRYNELKELEVPVPPILEQDKIVAFLDHETAKIDRLIAKQERLIELLKEKRQAMISHAVTKGLNPDAPMKDSGVKWLGEVPEHWTVSRIKFLVTTPVTDGPHETPDILDEGVPFVSAEAVKDDEIDFSKIRGHISALEHARFSRKYKPQRGDIYMVKSGATTGNIAMVRTDVEFNIWSPLAAIRPNNLLIDGQFLFWFMRSRPFQQSVQLGWNYGTQQNIGMNVIENLPVVIPPENEQLTIRAKLDVVAEKFRLLIDKAQQSIELMREHRIALISAAVTGKIDVRNWQKPTTEPEETAPAVRA